MTSPAPESPVREGIGAAPACDVDLRSLRRTTGVGVDCLAAELGVHPNTVLRWERRQRLPGPKHVRALAAIYGLPVSNVASFFDRARSAAPAASGCHGRGLRRLRVLTGLTAAQVASAADVPVHTVYNWESGRARVPRDRIRALADLFSLRVHTLEHVLRSPAQSRLQEPPRPLRRLRQAAGLSQVELARKAGVGLSSLKAWEQGGVPALSDLRGLALALDLSTHTLAGHLSVDLPRQLLPSTWRPGDLPDVLLVLRGWSRLTQRTLAERCGVSLATVRAWEQGRGQPADVLRSRLERLYRLSPNTLLAAYPWRAPGPRRG